MNLKPIGDRVIIKLVEKKSEERTQGGIILTTEVKDLVNVGEILAVGSSDGMHEMKIGDEIFFERGREIELNIEGERYYIVNLKDIYALKEC